MKLGDDTKLQIKYLLVIIKNIYNRSDDNVLIIIMFAKKLGLLIK